MGTDIHAHIETREPDKHWRYEHELDVCRSYAFFVAIAGVRGEPHKCRYPARGLPEDTTLQTRELYGDFADHHHASWLTADEWLFAADMVGNSGFETLRGLRDLAAKYGVSVRVVFWFDS